MYYIHGRRIVKICGHKEVVWHLVNSMFDPLDTGLWLSLPNSLSEGMMIVRLL